MECASIPFDRKIYSQNPATSANRDEKRWIFRGGRSGKDNTPAGYLAVQKDIPGTHIRYP